MQHDPSDEGVRAALAQEFKKLLQNDEEFRALVAQHAGTWQSMEVEENQGNMSQKANPSQKSVNQSMKVKTNTGDMSQEA